MSKKQKNIILTSTITIAFIFFLAITIYTIYCYGYYEKNIKNSYVKTYNSLGLNFLYENLNLKSTNLTNDNYLNSLFLMFNKEKLKNIYQEYYQNKNLFLSEEDFLKKYFFNNQIITAEDIEFNIEGKTTLFHRAEISINKINIKNRETKSALGIVKNLTIKADNISNLTVGGTEICSDSVCQIPSFFGGLYEIKYEKDNREYYGLLNIFEDDSVIDIASLEDIVEINNEEKISLAKGKYYLRSCTKENDCPDPLTSYLLLEDNSCYMYTFISYSKTNDRYYGTYKIENGFLKVTFDKHVYTAFDFDTQEKTDIIVQSDMEYQYKIIDSNTIENNEYRFSK